MKKKIWSIIVFIARCLPSQVRFHICKLCQEVSFFKAPDECCRELLLLSDCLNWYIDQAAIRYENGIHPKHRLIGYHKFFTSRLKPKEKVLDVGCGIGAVAYSMAVAGAEVTGIDLDERMIENARSRYKLSRLDFKVGDINQDLPEKEFDTIVMSNVLEHIEDRIRLLRKIKAKYCPRRFLVRVPMIDRNWLVPFRKELGLFYYSDPGHHTEYTYKSLENELSAAGLSISHHDQAWGELWVEAIPVNAIDE